MSKDLFTVMFVIALYLQTKLNKIIAHIMTEPNK